MKDKITKILTDKLIYGSDSGREVIFEHQIEEIVEEILLIVQNDGLCSEKKS